MPQQINFFTKNGNLRCITQPFIVVGSLLLGVYTLIKQKNNKVIHTVKFIFKAKIVGKKLKSKDKLKYKWFTFHQIKLMKEKLWDPDIIHEIEDYNRGKSYPLDIFVFTNCKRIKK